MSKISFEAKWECDKCGKIFEGEMHKVFRKSLIHLFFRHPIIVVKDAIRFYKKRR